MDKKHIEEKFLELTFHNPTIHRAVSLYQQDLCTWEEALMLSVITLAEQNDQITENIKYMLLHTTPIPVQNRGE
jgi:hypothetical protein